MSCFEDADNVMTVDAVNVDSIEDDQINSNHEKMELNCPLVYDKTDVMVYNPYYSDAFVSKAAQLKYDVNLNVGQADIHIVVFISNNLKTVEKSAFLKQLALNWVSIPNCERIEERGFSNCYSLRRLNSKRVLFIGQHAFNECQLIRNVNFYKVQQINKCAFWACYSLQTMRLDCLERLEDNVFAYCYNLFQISAPKLQFIHENAVSENADPVLILDNTLLKQSKGFVLLGDGKEKLEENESEFYEEEGEENDIEESEPELYVGSKFNGKFVLGTKQQKF